VPAPELAESALEGSEGRPGAEVAGGAVRRRGWRPVHGVDARAPHEPELGALGRRLGHHVAQRLHPAVAGAPGRLRPSSPTQRQVKPDLRAQLSRCTATTASADSLVTTRALIAEARY
jgi:hypothetical protein